MHITDIFIKRPILAVVVNIIIVLVGWRAAKSLPVQQYPKMESTSITISTRYFGASAEDVRGFITTPLERSVAAIDGIDYVESASVPGLSTITIRLRLNHNTTDALAAVSARIDQVRNQLPQQAEAPAVEVTRADRPFASFYLSAQSKTLDRMRLTEFLSRIAEPGLLAVRGVQRAQILGGEAPAMRIWLDPVKLAGLGLGPSDIQEALRRNNFIGAVGRTRSDAIQIELVTDTNLTKASDFSNIIIREIDGAAVRLSDVATVELGPEEAYEKTAFGGNDAIFIGIWALPGVNEIELAGRLRKAIDELNAQFPEGTTMTLAYDATLYMEKALKEIAKTLAETIGIVAVVVFIFLGSIRTVLVPLVAIPLSLVGAAIFMSMAGFSLNLLTILAIVLAVGLVVDDAIVVVENIERRVREGLSRSHAALLGARELFSPIISMTITLAAVYAPIGFQGGLTGVLFREFAFTLAAAVVVSGLVAVTLSPIMSAMLVNDIGHQSAWTRWINARFDWLKDVYGRLLQGALTMPRTMSFLCVAAILFAPVLYRMSLKELAPVEDQSGVFFGMQSAPEASLRYTSQASAKISELLKTIPETRFIWQITQSSGGFGGIQTVGWEDRTRTTHEILPELYGMLSNVPEVRCFPQLPPSLPGAGSYDVELVITTAGEANELGDIAGKLVQAAFASGMFLYADTSLKIDQPQARLTLDRNRLADLGFDAAAAGQELSVLLSGGYVNRFNLDGRSYTVIPQLPDSKRASAEQLMDIKVTHPSGAMVPVSSFTSLETSVGPRSLDRFQQLNSIRVFGAVLPGVTKEQALGYLEGEARKLMTVGTAIDYAGESRQIRREGSSLVETLILALALIYLVLAAQFASFRDPLIILLGSVPLALLSALVLTFANLTTINIYSQVGLITLVGLISKNGILIVEFARTLQEQGVPKVQAVREASITRLRPILMTTAATVFGHLPLVFVTGAGAAARNSIGIVLVVGMTIGTLFTLFVVPALYVLVATDHKKPVEEPEPVELKPSATPALA